MPNTNPTLYENFQRVKEWSIEKFADKEQLAYALADVAFTGDYADLINTPDLNSYVSKAELSECGYLTAVPNDYPTYAAISGMAYITAADVSAMGYITSIPSEYITQDELSANSYLTSVPAGYATEAYVSAAIADLVSTAPATLDTLEEIAQALGDDPNFAATITAELAKKLEKDDYYADQVAAGVLTYNSATSTYSANVMVSQSALEAMGYITSIPAEYVTDAELSSMGYITSIPSEYITETELSACGYLTAVPSEYVTDTEISGMGYITRADVSAMGYITSIPSEYITETELSGCGYVTALTQAEMDTLFPISNI